jgi:hypothetical protein
VTSLESMLADSDRAARSLHLQLVSRETETTHHRTLRDGKPPAVQHHLCCYRCGQSVWCLTPDATSPAYVFPLADALAQVGMHIRQCHGDMIPLT